MPPFWKFHIATRLDSRGGSEPDYPPRIVDIEHSVGGKATLVLEDSSRVRVQLRYAWRSLLVKSCVSALEIALPTHAFDVFFARFSRILSMPGESANSDIQSEWNAFVVNVLSFVLADTTEGFDPKPIPEWEQLQRSSLHARSTIASVLQPCKLAVGEKIEGVTFLAKHARRFASSDNEVVRPHLASIVISLHLIREDLRLDVSTIERLPFLNELLLFIAKEFQLPNHVRYYKNVSFTTIELVGFTGSNHTQLHEFMSEHPVDIMQWLNKKMTFQSVVDFPCLRMFSDLAHLSGDSYLEIPLSTCCANTRKICSFYNSLFATDGFFDDEALLMDMIKERFSRADLDMLPFGIAVPLLDSLRRSRLHPKQHWPLDAFILIGRQDLAEQLTASALVRLSKAHQKIEEKALSSEQGLWDSAKDGKYTQKLESGVEIQSDEVSNLRFPEDRRLEEVASMLDSSKCIETQLTDSNAADVTAEQQLVLQAFSSRTASLPLGRALFTYGTSTPEITEPLNIPQMQFSGKFIGHYGIVALDMQPFPPDFQDWCQFHNGVAAGLRISPEFTEIDSAWIQLNGRAEPSAEHAGLMLGFGLNGHLRKLVRGDTFQFLSQNYELMRIAMLLGYSASYCSSTDSQAYRLLSMHIPSLRPPRSELNVGPLTQTAAIMGIGLVFMGSLHRHMVETLLAELGRKEFPASVTVISTPPEVTANVFRETYSLTCGMALGMVALGRADEGSGLSDLSIVNELRRYIQGGRESDRTAFVNNSTVCFGRQYAVKESEKINVDVTAPGACIALAFMYMKSNNAVVAQLVGIPQTRFDLDYIRPDIIMLRVLCTNLIIWDDIRPSMEWVENLIPNFIKAGMEHDGRGSTNVPSGELQILTQAQDSIVAGACFSIALRFAGSANSSAYACLMAHFKRFKSQSTFVATTFEERLIKFARKACLDVVTMSLGILMAGSGSLSLMRTLRTLHARTSADVSFGSHAATHMALGLLFLGGGCYTIGTSNKAIAALVCAFFPRLPQHPTENRFHLQAIRHFWVLALEPRVLVTRDVETKAAVSTSVEVFSVNPIEKRGKLEKSVMMTPCLLPDLGMIRRITFRGTRFLPIDIVFTSSMTYRERLTRIRLVFLKRKSGYLDQFNEHGEGTRVKTTPFDFPGVITFESDENQLARPFPRSLATALAGCVGTLGTPITAVKTLWQIRQRRIARKDLVRSFSSDPILQDFAHYLCNLRGDTNDSYDDLESNAEFESERYFTEYAVAALYEALALDRSDGLVLFLDVYKCVERLFGSDCEPDPSDMWNLRYFLDYAKVCFEVKSRERERMRGMVGAKHDDSDENLFISLEFAKSLRARISLLIYLRRDVAPPDRLKDLEALLN
ncbi:hypothetical protein BJ742DRAFT_255061 [Cladochytrium replicatum]|nr:hypothetical protein BJ742DRAFT_255061 [Cladochytrium replicatum]